MIVYRDSVERITPDQLRGFFVGWPKPPSPETHLKILKNSDHIVLAIDDEGGNVVGFITAISDGVLSAYIPLLEVLKSYQRQGIGTELVRRMMEKLRNLLYDRSADRSRIGTFLQAFWDATPVRYVHQKLRAAVGS